jgi:hypothetical protein
MMLSWGARFDSQTALRRSTWDNESNRGKDASLQAAKTVDGSAEQKTVAAELQWRRPSDVEDGDAKEPLRRLTVDLAKLRMYSLTSEVLCGG